MSIFLLLLSAINCNKKEIKPIPVSPDSISIISTVQAYESEGKNKSETEYSMIKRIDSKIEIRNDGDFNKMTLFEVEKDISLDQLKEYCSTVKPSYREGYFQILVFFKKPYSARFPDNSVTGMYMEEDDMKNIKASYTINNKNGYSKLEYYDNNNYESHAETVTID